MAGLVFVVLTLWTMGGHSYRPSSGIGFEYFGYVVMILLLPGIFTSVMLSGNIHVFSTWIAVLANFVFYFGVVYVTLGRRKRGVT